MVIIDGNPLTDIRTSENIRTVIANGRVFDARTMAQIYPKQVPAPSYFFTTDGVNTDPSVRGADGCVGCRH